MGTFLFASDLHGDVSLYEELLVLSVSSGTRGLILGGDLLPSPPPGKRYEEMISSQEAFIENLLLPYFRRMIETTPVQQIFLIPGNWDLSYPYLLGRAEAGVIDLSNKKFPIMKEFEIIGYPFVPPTPFRPKDFEKMDDSESPWPPQKYPSYLRSSRRPDLLIQIDPVPYLKERGTIQEDLSHLPAPRDPRRAIYVMHSPPFGTALDRMHGGGWAGSRSIKTFIERTQPLLTLHGHIHEAPECSGSYKDRIEKTLSINPGQFTRSGREGNSLHAVLFEIEAPEETARHTLFRSRQGGA